MNLKIIFQHLRQSFFSNYSQKTHTINYFKFNNDSINYEDSISRTLTQIITDEDPTQRQSITPEANTTMEPIRTRNKTAKFVKFEHFGGNASADAIA